MRALTVIGYRSRHGRATVYRNDASQGYSVVVNAEHVYEYASFDEAETFAAGVCELERQSARCDARAWGM